MFVSLPRTPLPPRIGAGSSQANTAGGQQVVLLGTGYGPVAFNAITNVTYGKTGVEYAAAACVVLADPAFSAAQIQCVTAPGTGAGLSWIVTVAGQASDPWGFTDYAPPSIAAFDGSGARGADTVGAQLVQLSGVNFGPALGPRDVVSYQVAIASYENSTLPVASVGGVNGTLVFYPINCTVATPHTMIGACTCAGMWGRPGTRVLRRGACVHVCVRMCVDCVCS